METRPYPWTCPGCRQRTVHPDVVDYTTTVEHDGRAYTVRVPSLEVPKCRNCGKLVLVEDFAITAGAPLPPPNQPVAPATPVVASDPGGAHC